MRCLKLTDRQDKDYFLYYMIDEDDVTSEPAIREIANEEGNPFFVESAEIISEEEVIIRRTSGRQPFLQPLRMLLALTVMTKVEMEMASAREKPLN